MSDIAGPGGTAGMPVVGRSETGTSPAGSVLGSTATGTSPAGTGLGNTVTGTGPASGGLGPAVTGLWHRYHDLLVAFGIVAVVGMMIVPLSAECLDALLAVNLALTLVILLVAVYNTDPLQFSVLPSLLLLVTLFRLALNISGTRLILLYAHAGQVINAFGTIVVGNSYIVGAVVFAILVVIQFVVITNGAQRVAEVAARFTLDGMPGKQMGIDADLNAGTITDAEARRRRQAIQEEADFYGAMDGASKFVRGDAIAAVIIIIVNVVGGLMIGVLKNDMGVLQALQTYTLLTVGEGLVTQIPALLVSTATGIVVTRAASNANLGQDLTSQLVGQPRAMGVVAVLMLGLLLVPGLPRGPFLMIGGGLGLMAWILSQAPPADEDEGSVKGDEKRTSELADVLNVPALELSVGSRLIPLVDRARGGALLERLTDIRREVATRTGVPVPAVHVRDVVDIPPHEYVLRLFGAVVAQGELYPDQMLAVWPPDASPGTGEGVAGRPTVDPANQLPALWIAPAAEAHARASGLVVVPATDVLTTHLFHVLEAHAAELLGRQDVRRLLDLQKAQRPVLVDDLVPALLPLGDVQRVLRNLLEEHIPIRNLPCILEAMADAARSVKEPAAITEQVRRSLARTIAQHFAAADGALYVIAVAAPVEQAMMAAMSQPDKDIHSIIGLQGLTSLHQSLTECLKAARKLGVKPVVLTNASTRLYFKLMTERSSPDHVVISYSEIPRECVTRTVAQVRFGTGTPFMAGSDASAGSGALPVPGTVPVNPTGPPVAPVGT